MIINLMNDTLAAIRYNTSETLKTVIPYSLEIRMSNFAKMEDGAQLIEIGKDGKETLKAIYDVDFGRFIPIE